MQNMTARLAAMLADGGWHPGPELARNLGVTRARVSQQIRALRDMGLDVFSVNGRGYRLPAPLALLDADRIRGELSAAADTELAELEVLSSIDSTNAHLMRSEDARTRACLAEYQSAGRGRRQRAWASPFGANVYLSVSHVMHSPRAPLGTLSLGVGVALCERLLMLGAAGIGLKWPNDVYADGDKLAGILVEHRGEAGGPARVVVGIGLNVQMQPRQADHVDQPWASLAACMPAMPERSVLAGQLLDALLVTLATFERDGFSPFRHQWQIFDLTRDRDVVISDGRFKRSGVARGIGEDGALQVEFDGGMESVYAGDVSLRIGMTRERGA